MAVLKSYTCSKCGGVLNFDSDQEFFDCPFCGERFDVADFHADELFSQAEESLKQKAFSSAKEKYSAILEKEPNNFEALRGSVFSRLEITSFDDIKDHEKLRKLNLVGADKALDAAISAADVEDKAYFQKFSELIYAFHRMKHSADESKVMSSAATSNRINHELEAKRKKLEYDEEEHSPGRYVMGFIVALVMLIMGFISKIWIIAGFGAITILCLIMGIAVDKSRDEMLAQIPKNSHKMRDEASNKVEMRKSEYEKLYSDLLELETRIRTAHQEKANREEEAPEEPKPEISAEDLKSQGTIICAKCGAALNLDTDKRVYQCNSCGVAYGVSLFFGLPLEKALKSMNQGKFDEARQRFANVLMADPSDFEANLGLILSIGKWSRVSDIDDTDNLPLEDSRSIYTLVRQAKTNSSESDSAYFDELGKLISMLKKLCENKKIIDELKDELTTIKVRTKIINRVNQSYSEESNEMITKKLMDQIVPRQKEYNKLKTDFNNLRESVLSMRSDSVLTK